MCQLLFFYLFEYLFSGVFKLIASFLLFCYLVVFHKNLRERKSTQVLFRILADIYYVVVTMMPILSLIISSSRRFTKPLGTVSSALNTIGITVTLMFHSFSGFWPGPSICFLFTFFNFLHSIFDYWFDSLESEWRLKRKLPDSLSINDNFYDVVIWIVSTLPQIYWVSCPGS